MHVLLMYVGGVAIFLLMQAKLQYDPVELDHEDMCRMACEDPQVGMGTGGPSGTCRLGH